MLAKAVATGKPTYIYPLPEEPPGLKLRASEWVVVHSNGKPSNDRGTVRPQQGLEYACSWLLERGFIRPPRDLGRLHDALIRGQMAHRFGEPLDLCGGTALHEIDDVARRVGELVGFDLK